MQVNLIGPITVALRVNANIDTPHQHWKSGGARIVPLEMLGVWQQEEHMDDDSLS